MSAVLRHLRGNVVAYLALFVALGGTSYAAFIPSPGSVGAKQIRNHSITPVKLNPKFIAASIRAWADIQWKGTTLAVVGSSSRVRLTTVTGGVAITWPHHRFPPNCMPSVTPETNFTVSQSPGGFVTADLTPTDPAGAFLRLLGFLPDGSSGPRAAYVMIICP